MVDQELFDNRLTGRLVLEAVSRLFDRDGTLYLATGYFTWSGYLSIRDSLLEFLETSPDNEVFVVVSTGADQFSRLVADELWRLDDTDRIHVLTYRDGFIHPKLYLRAGSEPALVIGSANLTWDGLSKNLEIAWYYAPDGPDDAIFRMYLDWMVRFIAACDPVTPADLRRRTRLHRTANTWMHKGRINLPTMLRGALFQQRRSGPLKRLRPFRDDER